MPASHDTAVAETVQLGIVLATIQVNVDSIVWNVDELGSTWGLLIYHVNHPTEIHMTQEIINSTMAG